MELDINDINLWLKTGIVVFNNDPESRAPTSIIQPIKGCTTGRNRYGKFDGTLSIDDVTNMHDITKLNGSIDYATLFIPKATILYKYDIDLPQNIRVVETTLLNEHAILVSHIKPDLKVPKHFGFELALAKNINSKHPFPITNE